MTLPHQNATATITIDGLAVCCFNPDQNAWEVGYLHHPHVPLHSLELRIEGETGTTTIDHTHSRIIFNATNSRTPPYPGSPNGFFDPSGVTPDRKGFPTTADDLENFRWLINLQDPADAGHGHCSTRQGGIGITRAFLHNAVGYTSRIASRDVYRIPFNHVPPLDPNNMTEDQRNEFLFGKINDTTSFDIFCDPVDGFVSLEIPGLLPLRILRHRPGNPWKINLQNLCFTADTKNRFEIGDFQLFYDVLRVDGQQQAIWGEPLFDANGIKESGRVDCDITWLGATQSLDDIMP
jgi:hypothetical protein